MNRLLRKLAAMTAAAMLLLLPWSTYSEPAMTPEIEQLELRSELDSSVVLSASLQGADSFTLAWRLHESQVDNLYVDIDNTIHFQAAGGNKSVLSSGERVKRTKPSAQYVKAPEHVTVQQDQVVKREGDKLSWSYKPANGSYVIKESLQTDEAQNIYFLDSHYHWYSLDPAGRERYILRWESEQKELACKVTPSGDTACSSPQLGLIGIREKNDSPRILVNGVERNFPQRPEIWNGSTFVPLRSVFEALGAEVAWDQETRTIEASKGKRSVKITIDSEEAYINGRKTRLVSPPLLYNDVTMVPLRFVGEALGANVVWEEATRTIQIVP
ncbi:copper amine oxidase N-terminal domain-containing protein [Paenibacillus silviterrae]|uniref:copper amine oxidase N-terminal domain-containing protein n=1 Tax=Paenibacillus silviterrae TaxID=3242194 RepID=UPI002543663C|nr:copper amine oxidase N-terminal domain-containing protein [Paenibacillus chinjuensis]